MKHSAKAIDWVVKMRRLPAERSLDRLLKAGTVTKDHRAQIAAKLSQFYTHLTPLRISAEVYHQRLRALIGDNRQALLDSNVLHAKPRIKRIHAAQLQFVELSNDIFAERVGSRIVDGHGDLRAEHIYLAPDPLVIDCIEFNADMRQVDVADELAFLEMECEMLDDCEPVHSIASQCLAALGDAPPPQLVSFYKSYRACVRAKVAALRAEQGGRKQSADRRQMFRKIPAAGRPACSRFGGSSSGMICPRINGYGKVHAGDLVWRNCWAPNCCKPT